MTTHDGEPVEEATPPRAGVGDEMEKDLQDSLTALSRLATGWLSTSSCRKWYRNWAVAQLLAEHLRALNLTWPAPDFDVELEKVKLAGS